MRIRWRRCTRAWTSGRTSKIRMTRMDPSNPDSSRQRRLDLVRLKPLVFLACCIPAALLLWNAYIVVRGTSGLTDLGADPVRALEIRTGLWTLRFLAITLAVP